MIAKTFATALIAMIAFGAQAADTSFKPFNTDVRFHWQPAENTVTVTYYTGCISAHGGIQLQDDIQAYLDWDYLQFDLQGGYQIAVPKEDTERRVGSTDCMGSRQKTVTFSDIERETYVVNRHGYLDRNITLGDEEIAFTISDTSTTSVKRTKPAMFLTAD